MWRISYGTMSSIKVQRFTYFILEVFYILAQKRRDNIVFLYIKLHESNCILALAIPSRSLTTVLEKPL